MTDAHHHPAATGFTPLNEVEELLVAAARDATARPLFVKALLEAELFFVVAAGDATGTRVQAWQRDGQSIVPVFTSPARSEEFAHEVDAHGMAHAAARGRELLAALRTAHVVLNPVSDYGKEFYPEEIEGLLDGSELKRLKIVPIEQGHPVIIAQPARYPQQLVNALRASFGLNKRVRRAYLVHVHQPAMRRAGQFVVGIEADDDFNPAEALHIAQETLGEDEFIGFLKLGADEVSAYMRDSAEPFYARA